MKSLPKSAELIANAQRLIPGGVNSPVRAFRGVGGTPVFFESGSGAHVQDVDGNTYIDYVGSWGPMILGHTPEEVVTAVQTQAGKALGFGAPTALEIDLAEELVDAVPSVEKVRLVNSGTEATMSAIRVARGATGRDLILKFAGCYHGHSDSLLVKAGSGVLTLGLPDSPGVPAALAELTLNLEFNDEAALGEAFARYGDRLACVIVEPIAGNMGCIPGTDGFLKQLRSLCTQHGALLIFDEVMTGFRVAHGGAQALYGITPDLTTLGKIVGGGLPLAAFGGSAAIMANVAPEGNVYQAGTLSGNPIAVTAGLTTLKALREPGFYERLSARSERFATGLRDAAAAAGVPVTVNDVCGMLSMFFTKEAGQPVSSYADVAATDSARYAGLFHALLERGVYLAPSAFEVAFLSRAHDEAIIDETLTKIADALKAI